MWCSRIFSVELNDLEVKPRVKLKLPLSLSKIALKKMTSNDRPVEPWLPYPEYNEKGGALLTKGIVCSHNFTHLRVRTCTTSVYGVLSDAS